MGRSASFLLVFKSSDKENFLSAITNHTDGHNLAELSASLDRHHGTPAGESDGVHAQGLDNPSSCSCLTFFVPAEASLAGLDTGHSKLPSHVSIGCIWTFANRGEDYFSIIADAATSEMAAAFHASSNLQAVFRTIAMEANAQCLILIDDWNCNQFLWCRSGSAAIEGQSAHPIDRQCAELIAEAHKHSAGTSRQRENG